jgi:hypothetical protein
MQEQIAVAGLIARLPAPESCFCSFLIMAERVGFEPTERFPVHSISSAASSTTPAPLLGRMQEQIARAGIIAGLPAPENCSWSFLLMAERVGFEPTEAVKPLRFSRPVH